MDTIKNNGYIKKMENKKNSLYYLYDQEQLFSYSYNKTYNYKKEKKIYYVCKSSVVSFEEATPLSKPKPIEVEARSQRTSITS